MSRSDLPQEERQRIGQRRVPVLPALIAVAGLFGVVMLAAGVQGLPQFAAPEGRATQTPQDDVVIPQMTESPPPMIEPPEDSLLLRIIGIVFAVLLAAAVLMLVVLAARALVRFLRRWWQDRPLARRAAASVAPEGVTETVVDAEPDEVVIRRGLVEALLTITERPDAGEGIVAAWIGLEESATDAGSGRAASETPTEFTARIIGRREGIAQDIVTLLGLYEQVRFGGMAADESDRASAAACLRRIQEGWR